MKKQYIQPASELILLQPAQLIAASPGANDQTDPGLTRELPGFDLEDPELERLLNM
jgi:hypothetical protein